MKEKKYSPWVNILKKHITKDTVEKVEDTESVWEPPVIPSLPEAKEASKEEEVILENINAKDPDAARREALYWKLHKEYYHAHLDVLSDDDRRTVSEQPDSPAGKKFHAKVKAEVEAAVDYQMMFLN